MVQFNFTERTIKAKVVYYGPAQSGKTTNLEQIHRLTDPAANNRLISLNTAQDRTLFFDLLPFSLGAVSGYDFKIQLYTVPGQVQYNATRRVVLAGADAVVFVADARRSLAKENQAAFENMKVNLLANRLVPEKVPLVFQYNKQDLPEVMSVAELSKTINPWGRPALGAVAAQGQGVIECFVAVVQDMLAAIAVKYNLKEKGLDPASVPSVVQEAFAEVLKNAAAAAAAPAPSSPAPRAAKVVVSHATDSLHAAPPQTGSETGLVSEELLHRSLRSNVELAESLSGMVREMNLGLGTILSQAELLMVHREDARDKRQAAILAIQQEATRLKKVVAELGDPSAASARGTGDPVGSSRPPASTPTMTSSRSIPSPPARPAAPPPVPRAAAPPVRTPSAANASLHELLQDVLGGAQDALDAQELSVDLRVPMTTSLPSCPPLALRQALVGTVEGLVTAAFRGTQLSLRCERKPVLLKGRDGEVKRDFLMLALAHTGNLSPEDQQRVVQGTDPGPLGQATRLFREMGGFVRFAPLPGGALETRVFLPVA
jgi:signal recognition particle receptor subunit beta